MSEVPLYPMLYKEFFGALQFGQFSSVDYFLPGSQAFEIDPWPLARLQRYFAQKKAPRTTIRP